MSDGFAAGSGLMARFGIDPALVISAFAVLAISIVLGAVAERIVRRIARRERAGMTRSVVTHTARAFRTLVPVCAFLLWLTMVGVSRQALLLPVKIAAIVTSGWFLIGVVRGTVYHAIDRYDISHADNLRARQMQTQIRLLGRVVGTFVATATAAGVLITIPGIRNVGVSLFASAGIAGLAVGLAARPVLGNMLAGIQIALTQPIRLDDVVVVEGEWGRIEEINLTFVVVRIWDLRRLILPVSYFIERPFQNWTRTSARILGAVSIQADFKLPLADVRAAFDQALQASRLWDGDTAVVQVTDSTDRTMQVRLLMSAADSGTAWDLRCYIREYMIDYLKREHADALPRVRLEPTDRTAAA